MKPEKLRLFFWALRNIATSLVAACEDVLEVAYDESALVGRREKVR